MIRALLVVAAISAAAVGLAPVAFADSPYANCTKAHKDGRWDIPKGDDAYWPAGDRDQDGVACES
jgi:hypothetical protein